MAERIEIMREDLNDLFYGRFRRNPNPPSPPVRQRGEHGRILRDAMDNAIKDARSARRVSGINTDNLMVLELISDAMTSASLEKMLTVCCLWIVEEVKIDGTNKTKLLVQFEDSDALARFESERALYMNESEEQGALALTSPPSLYQSQC